jgi:hypothetical protein
VKDRGAVDHDCTIAAPQWLEKFSKAEFRVLHVREGHARDTEPERRAGLAVGIDEQDPHAFSEDGRQTHGGRRLADPSLGVDDDHG